MMNFLHKNIFFILALMVIFISFYFGRDALTLFVKNIVTAPCSEPIVYSLDMFDPKFGLTKTEFLKDITKAEKIWENVYGKDLFIYSDKEEGLRINLIYDDRQKSTDALKKIGLVINDDKETYLSLKTKYDALVLEYNTDKKDIENLINILKSKKDEYEKEVDYWNSRGGAPKSEYEKLQSEKDFINSSIASINQKQTSLNNRADTINALATAINGLIDKLNLNVSKYNTTRVANGEEFDEGEYIKDATGEKINVYQFANEDKLIRVLAHELGHALGLDHVEDPKAIMYKLNQSSNEKLTAADIAELQSVCKIKR